MAQRNFSNLELTR